MFKRQYAQIYDALYLARGRDFAAEAAEAHDLICAHGESTGKKLLDVACGTGAHLTELRKWYEVEGLDSSSDMLAVGAERLPGVPLHCADMTKFDLGRRFDVITCFFSSIGYTKTVSCLERTIGNFSRHLEPGGVILIEPWYSAEAYLKDSVHLAQVDKPDRKIVRINLSKLEDGNSVAYFHYLIADSSGVEYFMERHEQGLFSEVDFAHAFAASGLELSREAGAISDRGIYIGRLPVGQDDAD